MNRVYKYWFLVFAFYLISTTLYGQRSLGLTVISAFGHEASSATYNVVHTTGELMTETFTGTSGNFVLTQGFHQNDGIDTEISKLNSNLTRVYPNPTRGIVNIRFEGEEKGIIRLDLFDIAGRIVLNKVVDTKFENKLDISQFNNGIYFLRVSNASGKLIFTHKLEKLN